MHTPQHQNYDNNIMPRHVQINARSKVRSCAHNLMSDCPLGNPCRLNLDLMYVCTELIKWCTHTHTVQLQVCTEIMTTTYNTINRKQNTFCLRARDWYVSALTRRYCRLMWCVFVYLTVVSPCFVHMTLCPDYLHLLD